MIGGLVGCALMAGALSIHPDAVHLVDLVNDYRYSIDRPILTWDAGLARSAQWKAEDLNGQGRFTHLDSYDRRPGDLMLACGYARTPSGWGEALARAHPTPEQVLGAFLRSEPHTHLLRYGDYAAVGAAHVGDTWVLHVGGDVDQRLELF